MSWQQESISKKYNDIDKIKMKKEEKKKIRIMEGGNVSRLYLKQIKTYLI